MRACGRARAQWRGPSQSHGRPGPRPAPLVWSADMTNVDEDKLLILTVRDVQALVGMYALFSTLLSEDATQEQVVHNGNMLKRMFAAEYSASEANALGVRLCALLPLDACL